MQNFYNRQRIRLACSLATILLMLLPTVVYGESQSPTTETSLATQRAHLTLVLRMKPQDDPGRFHLQIDEETVAENVGHGGKSRAKPVRPGTHIVGIIASGQTALSDYKTTIVCKREQDGDDDDSDDDSNGDDDKDEDGNDDDDDDKESDDDDDNDDNDDDDDDDDDISAAGVVDSSRTIARADNVTNLALELADNAAVTCTITMRRQATSALAITMRTEPRVALPSGLIAYTLVYANRGQQTLNEVVLRTTVPKNSTFASAASVPGWQCTPDGQAGSICTFAVGELAVGVEGVTTFAVTVSGPLPAGVSRIQNNVSITGVQGNQGERQLLESSVQSATPVDALPELQITNSDGGALATAGAVVVYTLNYANTGNQAATGVVINEIVPKGAKFNRAASSAGWNCRANPCIYTVGSLAAGESGSVSFAITLNSPLPADMPEIENVATIRDDGSNGEERDLGNNVATEITPFAGRPFLGATMQAFLAVDADNNGLTSPGDTLEYRIIVTNPSTSEATGVFYTNRLVNDLRLIANSFRGDPGLAPKIDAQDERRFTVTLGKIAPNQPVSFSFRVTINNPASVTEIVNQGTVKAEQLAAVLTDDPTVAGSQDPTITPLDARPTVRVQMIDYLFLDLNNNELVDIEDTLIYGVTIVNVGNRPAAEVVWEQKPESNTLLVAGSIYSNKGAVVAGNQAGDGQTRIAIGRLAVGERVTINFEVKVAGSVLTSRVANQSVVTLRDSLSGVQFSVLSDDPDTPQIGDPTVTPVMGVPYRLFMSVIRRR